MFSLNKLKKLPVRTASGIALGKIFDVEFSGDPLRLHKICVHAGWFSNEKLLVAPEQIMRITEKEIVVTDSLVPAEKESLAQTTPAEANESFALNSETD